VPEPAELLDAIGATVVAFVLLAALFVPLERAFTARRQPLVRDGFALDLGYFVLQNAALSFVLIAFGDVIADVGFAVGPRGVQRVVASWPLLAQVICAVVIGDVVLYWGHRACHRVPLLWRFHAVHHSSTTLDWLAGYREHPLDGLFSQLCLLMPAALLGVPLGVIAPLAVLRGLCASFVHSNVRVPLGPFGLLFGDPVLHRAHHSKEGRAMNFANVAPYLDLLFGTHYRPQTEHYPLGVTSDVGATMLTQLTRPFVADKPRGRP